MARLSSRCTVSRRQRETVRSRIAALPSHLLVFVVLIARSDGCTNGDRYASCYRWAAAGQCKLLPRFMNAECPVSCGLCEHIAVDPCVQLEDSAGPGAIVSTFSYAVATHTELKPTVLSRDPFVVMFDEFAGAKEVEEIANIAEDVGFGAKGSSCGFKSVHKAGCNSASMSCIPIAGGSCWSHAVMERFEERMLEVVQLPAENCEPLRFFQYDEGETFTLHHDAAGQHDIAVDTPGGPRVWTLYVFLSAAASGGSFDFPRLNVSIAAKPGRAVCLAEIEPRVPRSMRSVGPTCRRA